MLKIGLSGGIGSGKSTIAKVFDLLRIPIYTADVRAKILMNKSQIIINELTNHFGKEIYVNGIINKPLLSKYVFGDVDEREFVNKIVHPIVLADFDDWCEKLQSPYVIHESALLFENDLYQHFDKNITVNCDVEIRIKRICFRDNINRQQALLRINSQKNDSQRASLADFVIENDEKNLVLPQILQIHEALMN